MLLSQSKKLATAIIYSLAISAPLAYAELGKRSRHNNPSIQSIEACIDLSEGEACTFSHSRGTVEGSCIIPLRDDTALICAPDGKQRNFEIVDTGQVACYDNDGEEIICPAEGEDFYGQDAQYTGTVFSFTDNGDGTVTDNGTGLMWQQTPTDEKFSWSDAQNYCDSLSLSEHDDWRTPNLKELFSISDFETGWPYIDTVFFALNPAPELKQLQYWSSNYYEAGSMTSAFGVNHGTGHIKAYPDGSDGELMAAKYVRCVRGDNYGVNKFSHNNDGTITDSATDLMWTQDDSGAGLDWRGALAFIAEKNTEGYLGYQDWRLPNVRELQSIVDYSGMYPAIDSSYFMITDVDSYFWSSTSAYFSPASPGYYYAWYVAFGYAVGPDGEDSHGAGAVRFDTKVEDGPAGEEPARIYNYVRLVRDAKMADGSEGRNTPLQTEPASAPALVLRDRGRY